MMSYVVPMSLSTNSEIETFATTHPGWTRETHTIRRTFGLEDFAGAIAFVNRVADAAETANHHPDIDIRWNRVTIVLSTHSEGGITGKDLDLAEICDAEFGEMGS